MRASTRQIRAAMSVMPGKWVVILTMACALTPAVTVRAAPFLDTFEPFNAGATVAGQGSWGALAGPEKATVQDAAGIAYAGEKYLDLLVTSGSTYPYRLGPIGTPLDATANVVSYAYRINDPVGDPGDQAYTFFWATGGGSTMVQTRTYGNGQTTYFPSGAGETNPVGDTPLNANEWYLFTYTYNLADQVNLKVTRALDNSVNLDVTWTTLVANQTSTYDVEWNSLSFAPGSSYHHALLDNVAITPEPSGLLMMLAGVATGMIRRTRRT
jgi:hypothetical protein